MAEICGEYLKKGKQVYIEGRIQTRSWEDKDGVKKYFTEIVAERMQMLGRRDEEPGSVPSPPSDDTGGPPAGDEEDDLPF